jgi:hypothetical protein
MPASLSEKVAEKILVNGRDHITELRDELDREMRQRSVAIRALVGHGKSQSYIAALAGTSKSAIADDLRRSKTSA